MSRPKISTDPVRVEFRMERADLEDIKKVCGDSLSAWIAEQLSAIVCELRDDAPEAFAPQSGSVAPFAPTPVKNGLEYLFPAPVAPVVDEEKALRIIWRKAREAADNKRIREYGRYEEIETPEMREAKQGGTYEQAEDLIERCRNHDMQ